jgi:hypothetical protein
MSREAAPRLVATGFEGVIISDDALLDATLRISETGVELSTATSEIGSWPRDHCLISQLENDHFRIEAEGETLVFIATDPAALSDAISAGKVPEVTHEDPKPTQEEKPADPTEAPKEFGRRRARLKVVRSESPPEEAEQLGTMVEPASPDSAAVVESVNRFTRETVADQAILDAIARHVKARRFLPDDYRKFALMAGGFLLAVAMLTGVAWVFYMLSGRAPDAVVASLDDTPAVTFPPVTVTTVPPVPTTADAGRVRGFLVSTPDQFAAGWNGLAVPIDESLTLPPVLGSVFNFDFAPYLSISGTADPLTGLMQAFTLSALPQGESEPDLRILTALGVAIGASEPTLSGSGRLALLEALGLDPRRPELGGLDGTVLYGGLRYHLVYVPERLALELTVDHEPPPAQG